MSLTAARPAPPFRTARPPLVALLLAALLLAAIPLVGCGNSAPAPPKASPDSRTADPAPTAAPLASPAQRPVIFTPPTVPLELEVLDVPTLKALINESRGKVLVLCLWSVHCPACLQELPELARLAGGYSSDQLHMVWASLDQDPALVERFFSQQQADVDLRMGTEDLARFTQAQYIPRLVIYDVHGALVFQDSGFYPLGMLQALVQKALKG